MGTDEWNKDLAFGKALEPYIDEIYRFIWPVEKIERLTKGTQPHILDQEFHIDTIISLTNGMQITSQEKCRRESYARFNEFTLEYNSNAYGKKGEYFKLCTDVYFYGYGDPSYGFDKANVFKVLPVKEAIIDNKLLSADQQNRIHSTASFKCYKFDDFNSDWFIFRK